MNILRYAQWIASDQFQTSLWCVSDSPLHLAAAQTELSIHLIPRHRKYFAFGKAFQLGRRFKDEAVDAVWIRDTRDIDVCGMAARLNGKVKCIYQQAMQLGVDKKDLFHTIRFQRIDLWISTLQFLADQVKVRTKYPANRIEVVPLSIDIQKFQNLIPKENARHEFGLPLDKVVLGVVGRIDPLKGQEFVIRAHAALVQEGFPYHLLIVGEPTRNEGDDYLNRLKLLTEELRTQNDVTFSPFRKDIETAYAAMDIFVMPSQGETFGMVTIEAMASGLPVVGTNTSGTPEILGFGKHGLLYTPGDSVIFTQHIRLLADEETRFAIGQRGQNYVIDHFSKEHVVSELRRLLEKTLNS